MSGIYLLIGHSYMIVMPCLLLYGFMSLIKKGDRA